MASSKRYWQWFADRAQYCNMDTKRLLEAFDVHSIPEERIVQLCNRYGDYTVRSELDSIFSASDLNIPQDFPEMLFKGFDLKNCSSTTEADVDAYAADLKDKGLISNLECMAHWNRAAFSYKHEQFENAFTHIQKAFELAKYSAGKNQYQIVNQYI